MKKTISLIISLLFLYLFSIGIPVSAISPATTENFDVPAKSAVLMDFNTGTFLYEKNPDIPLPPASVTKIMTLLLIMEAIDKGELASEDMITVSEYAASMGGSQVFLEAGETMPLNDFLKSIVIASANDCAVAMAEAVCGSEQVFVARMNKRAKELGMENTNFENVTGLDDNVTNHVTSARDIAIMSRELMKHKKIFEYSTIWMDSIRNGAFGLTNTNRLIRFYKGATGLKTGSTGKAGFCISATAERNGLHLIAVIMGSETRDIRNDAAKTLLDYGFSTYSVYSDERNNAGRISVKGGVKEYINCYYEGCEILINGTNYKNVKKEIELYEQVSAPIKKGETVGKVKYILNDQTLCECVIKSSDTVNKITYLQLLKRIFTGFILK